MREWRTYGLWGGRMGNHRLYPAGDGCWKPQKRPEGVLDGLEPSLPGLRHVRQRGPHSTLRELQRRHSAV